MSLNPGDVLDKYPHQLSGGQLQRMLIARALLLDIRLLVADEIISMLDASTRIDVLNLLGDLKARGLGILFITHDLSLGNYISDRTMILRRGSVVEMGATERVFGNPLHPYTKMLLASVPQLHTKWRTSTPSSRDQASRRRRRAGALVEVEDDHFVAPVGGRPRTGTHDRRLQRSPPATPRRRDPVGGAARRVERRRLALEPQPDHPARPDPAREQHLQLRGRAVRRRLRRRLPRRRHAPRDEPARGPERRRRRLGRSTTSRSPSRRPTRGCAEIQEEFEHAYDPRVTWLEDRYYVTWCNGYHGPTIGVGYTHDFETFHQLDNAFLPFNRNGVLFPRRIGDRYAMLSRPSDNGHTPFGDIFYSESPDLVHWGRHRHVLAPVPLTWESTKVGAGPTPIETDEGWLVLYHGVLTSCNGFVYSMGAALLDLDEPWQVVARGRDYLLAPQRALRAGRRRPERRLPVRGARRPRAPTGCRSTTARADTVVCLAHGHLSEVLATLRA